MREWFDDDEFWRVFEGLLFPADRLEEAKAEVFRILGLAELGEEARVLDLAAGLGRHALELARLGHRVVAVDRTRRYLAQAAAQAQEEGLTLETELGDMRAFSRPGEFDLALNLFSSFGYFDDPEDDLKVLQNLFGSLSPGGVLVMEMTSKEIMARDFVARTWHEVGDALVIEERTLEDGFSLSRCEWTLLRGATKKHYAFTHRLYAGSELRALLLKVGFSQVKLYGSFQAEPFDQEAESLVVLAYRS